MSLSEPDPRVRLRAIFASPVSAADLDRLIREDPASGVRRSAVVALAKVPGDAGWGVLFALTDPVWRVRDTAVRALEARVKRSPGELPELWAKLDAWPAPCLRFQGAAYCLRMRLKHPHPGPVPPTPSEPWRDAPWWDSDPAVLEQTLRHLADDDWKRDLPLFAGVLTLQDSKQVRDILRRIRELVVAAFVRLASEEDLKSLDPLLAEARHPTASGDAGRILGERRCVSPTWAVEEKTRRADAPTLTQNGFPRVFFPPLPRVAHPRPLGRTGLSVSPLGISGRYGLNERGFELAVEAGANLFFWEPEYRAQTRFWRLMPPSQRARLHVVAGTFAATAQELHADLDLARRSLGVERLAAFLVFWVRSPARFVPEVADALAEHRERGDIQAVGISTHQRAAAKRAILDGFDVVMLRHNFIHSGAETEVLPLAAERGTGVLVFSACCQGVTMKEGVSAADSYRYALAQPGVSACWTAPRNLDELRSNLAVLRTPGMPPERVAELRAIGAAAYPPHRAFLDGVRGR